MISTALSGVRIAATGSYRPGKPVPSTSIDDRIGQAAGTCERRLGIRCRHFAGGETTSVMAAEAARRALAAVDWQPCDLDLIVSASAVMEQWIPTQAVLVQQALGLTGWGTPVLDINATCLSFLAALDTVSYAVAAGRYRRVLIVSSEAPSLSLDWTELDICGNFGDGAAAILLERDENSSSAILAARFATYSEGARMCEIRAGGTLVNLLGDAELVRKGAIFRMDGAGAYRLTARHFPAFLAQLLQQANVTLDDVALIIPHQASAVALAHLRKLCGLPQDIVVDIFAECGNQVAASLPTALDYAIRSRRIKRGAIILLLGTAAGITLGGMAVRY